MHLFRSKTIREKAQCRSGSQDVSTLNAGAFFAGTPGHFPPSSQNEHVGTEEKDRTTVF